MLRRLWCVTLLIVTSQAVCADNWPEWRGPHGDGTCDEKGLPTKWSPTENVVWKAALPEPGNSTPVVWKDQVFVTQPILAQNRRMLMCFDRTDGRLLWQSGTDWTEADPTHSTNPLCSSSPVTDGERVIVWFGSAGLFCYDMQGHELWKRDLGIQKHIWGYGASPFMMDSSTSTTIPALASVLSFAPVPSLN